MTGHVIVIPTPIGHLGDLSLRTKEALARCDLVLCEDTRVCARLLEACGLKKPMLCYRDDNEQQQVSKIMDRLAQGACVGLTTDAGTPCISDPGYRIIHECRCRGVKVEGIPGPCAAILALSISGLPSHSFLFLGFPENRSAARLKLFTHYQSFDASLDSAYVAEMRSLENGTYSKTPIKSSYGYHVVYRIDQKEKPALNDVKDAIIEQLGNELESKDTDIRYKALIAMREEAKLKFTDEDLESKYNKYVSNYK